MESTVQHKGIIGFVQYLQDDVPALVMEFAENGTLHHYLFKQQEPIGKPHHLVLFFDEC